MIFASKKIQRVTNFALAALLMVSTLTASVPFIFSPNAAAASSVSTSVANLAATVSAASAGDTIDIVSSGTLTSQVVINKPLTITSSNGSVVNVAPNVNALGIQANDVTVQNIDFEGTWNFGDGATTRALEISSYNNITIKNNTFNKLRQPAYINDNTTGTIQNNYTNGTKGWVILSNTNLSFTGNTWGTNILDVAIIPAGTNAYNDAKVVAISDDNSNAMVENQFGTSRFSDAYVTPVSNGNTDAAGSKWNPYQSVQSALNKIVAGGTVSIADGTYTDTAVIKQNGTKIVGTSGNRDAVEIHTLPNVSGQGGIYSDGLSDITIKNLAVVGTPTFTNGGLIKLGNGTNGIIDNVVVKSADIVDPALARTNTTGININSFANISINNTYVAGLGRDGISFVGKQDGGVTTKNVSVTNTSISGSAWSGIAFYTKDASITDVVFQNNRIQYGERGIYVDGNGNTRTVTGLNGGTLNLANTVIKDNTNEYINNEQTADINAVGVVLDHQARASWNDVAAADLTPAELANVQTTRIKDATGKNPGNLNYGVVYLQAPIAPVITQAVTTLNSNEPTKNVAFTHSGTNIDHFEYREYINEAAAIADSAYYSPSVAAANRTKEVGGSWGTHTLYYAFVAVDKAGNRSLRSDVGKIIIDRDAPVVAITSHNEGDLVRGTVTVNGTVSDANLSVSYLTVRNAATNALVAEQNVNTAQTNPTVTFDSTTVANGVYKVHLEAKDATGNEDAVISVKDITIIVDNQKPTITVKASPDTIGSAGVYSKLSLGLYDEYQVAGYSVNGGALQPVTHNQYSDVNFIEVGSYHGAIAGSNTITVYDVAGNSQTLAFVLDNTITTPTLVSPAADAKVNGASLTQSWSSPDTDIDHYVYESYNDASATSVRFSGNFTTTSKTATNVGEATFWWRVKAIDQAGNVSAWSELRKLTVDNTAPTATFVFPARGPAATSFQVTYNEDVNATDATNPANYFLINWPGAGGSGNLDGHALVNYDAPSKTATVSFTTPNWYVSGEQLWGVSDVKDIAGNTIASTTARSSILTSPTAPGTPVATTPSNNLSINWTWTAATDLPTPSEDASGIKGYQYKFTQGSTVITDWTNVATTGVTTVAPSEGTYELSVRALDNAGSVAGPASTGSVVIDQTAPTADVSYSPASATNNDVTATLTANEALDASTLSGWTQVSSTVYTKVYTANATETVTFKDTAGNEGSAEVAINWIDKTAPTATINTLPTYSTTATPTITGTYASNDSRSDTTVKLRIDGETIVAVTDNGDGTWSYTPAVALSEGTHTFVAIATDAVGNSSESALDSTTIDTVAPNVYILNVDNNNNVVTFRGNADVDATLTVSFNGQVVDVTNDNGVWTYVSGTLNPGQTYAFAIEARDAAGNGTIAANTVTTPATPAAAFTVTPTTVGPAAVLGATTDNDQAAQNGSADVAGATDDKTTDAAKSEANNGSIFGLAWYWWILILAAIAAIAWFIIGAIRNRNNAEA